MFKKISIFIVVFIMSLCLSTHLLYAVGSKTGIVTASCLNVRSGPGINFEIISTLNNGDTVSISDVSNDWYQIDISGNNYGWVNKNYVSIKSTLNSRGMDYYMRGRPHIGLGTQMVNYAKIFLGIRYVWGGTSPEGFDCSGFMQYILNHFGVGIERTAEEQATEGVQIDKSNLIPGDLVFFDTRGRGSYINHVGMYIGNGSFIQASSGYGHVVISDLTQGFYLNTYMTARRINKN